MLLMKPRFSLIIYLIVNLAKLVAGNAAPEQASQAAANHATLNAQSALNPVKLAPGLAPTVMLQDSPHNAELHEMQNQEPIGGRPLYPGE